MFARLSAPSLPGPSVGKPWLPPLELPASAAGEKVAAVQTLKLGSSTTSPGKLHKFSVLKRWQLSPRCKLEKLRKIVNQERGMTLNDLQSQDL